MTEKFEVVELEYSEDEILYYLVDEDGIEIGFAIDENGREVEYYYEGFDGNDYEVVEDAEPSVPEKAEDHGYLHKLAAIAGHEGGKARDKAEEKIDMVRGKAKEQVGKAKTKAAENDLEITRESVKEATADLNAIAKEGAETAKELKEAYDDIMDNFGFLMPNKVRRRLP